MVDKIVTIFTTALAVTALGIALRPNAPTAAVLSSGLNGFANIQRAAFGPS
jgi:hypothetical protein